MSYLTARAEQALIGAMLTQQPLPGEFAHLRAEDFGHRALRDLYTAITDLRDHTPTDRLPDAVAAHLNTPDLDATWLRELRDACPDPAHLPAYARMVQVAAFRRDIAREGERIAAGQSPDGLDRLADALTRQTQVFEAFTTIDERHATRLPPTTPDPVAAATDRATREDQLLADLLANTEQAADVARIVPPDTFTSAQRREVFMTIAMLAAEGEPVDEVIVLWEFQQLRANAALYEPDFTYRGDRTDADLYGGGDLTYRGEQTSPEATTSYLARLAATTVVTGTAISIGYQLVVEDERGRLAHSAAASAQRQAIDAQPGPRPGPQPQHDPALRPPAAGQPGPQPRIDR